MLELGQKSILAGHMTNIPIKRKLMIDLYASITIETETTGTQSVPFPYCTVDVGRNFIPPHLPF